MSTIFIKVVNKSHDLPQIRQNTDARTIERIHEFCIEMKMENTEKKMRGRETYRKREHEKELHTHKNRLQIKF